MTLSLQEFVEIVIFQRDLSSKKNINSNEQGYIALMAAIVITAVLFILASSLSLSGYFARFNILYSEFKEKSLGLAEACVDTGLLNLATNSSYNPVNEIISVSPDSCKIISLQNGVPNVGQSTLITTATFQKAVTNLKIVVDKASLSIVSWEEIPTL